MNSYETMVFQQWLSSLLEQEYVLENKITRINNAIQFILTGGLSQ